MQGCGIALGSYAGIATNGKRASARVSYAGRSYILRLGVRRGATSANLKIVALPVFRFISVVTGNEGTPTCTAFSTNLNGSWVQHGTDYVNRCDAELEAEIFTALTGRAATIMIKC